ncbi:hypothetical protein GXP67_22035 [Rhodocytophaga rosea]|uniref:Uncharacterized protein n=1 Tax=Rhodocytophaga rosea TaxID=2704465 RepID=A0A6C0GM31_9BACT|nr:hypothetical protein [Rhodocytophaga rosea]QHT69131.1 hypothetical protein GXP67_22035 [Rhodocytophaga rosea]
MNKSKYKAIEHQEQKTKMSFLKHEIWQDEEGKTMLCLAMSIYYQFMHWGEYITEFEGDKQPYKK